MSVFVWFRIQARNRKGRRTSVLRSMYLQQARMAMSAASPHMRRKSANGHSSQVLFDSVSFHSK
jgi:hypothetical protein